MVIRLRWRINTMDIKQEDLIRFWTWCGFARDGVGIWHCPNKIDELGKAIPKLDLNNLNRYAIPKLNSKNMAVTLIIFDGCRALIHVLENGYIYSWDAPTPTEALYNAIMKVIDNEVK
jgi:hypothetical protein